MVDKVYFVGTGEKSVKPTVEKAATQNNSLLDKFWSLVQQVYQMCGQAVRRAIGFSWNDAVRKC
ncbi:MAG: hypothetical protein ACXV5N_13395 [Halobacteriota archaeon]